MSQDKLMNLKLIASLEEDIEDFIIKIEPHYSVLKTSKLIDTDEGTVLQFFVLVPREATP